MNRNLASQQYQKIGLNSALAHATPHQQVLMLMNGALGSIATAKGAIERKNTELKGTSLSKAISIIGGLQASLADTESNEIAQNLDNLYIYMSSTLMKANIESSVEKLDEVTQLLLEIKSAWEKIPAEHHNTQSPVEK
ncbi:flagellar export chaperone FliS [Amphritea pacifica]|uniref:Flagellar secretion chaperone FliS n=1 Tax=Amphritea pacifica TaxID=2811233 RepID=A0ABS2W516_9GAMM|nr:flagellar export chaperone FliS [Amphritea pacifica]MBN0986808.1 flagellar export chaperone FliS [Amphritea pacifica]MBN1005249.1 flagellar export chaperone FliS [Amphritea pacifica]